MSYNNQLNLPVDPFHLLHRPLNLSINHAPLVPDYQGPHWVAGLLPAISAAAAIEIQDAALQQNANPLRIFMYNLFAENQFNNPLFADLVCNLADFIACYVNQGRWPNPDAALPEAVRDMIEMVAASHVRRFPDLGQVIDRQMFNAVQELIAQLDNVAGHVQQFMNGMQQAQPVSRNYGHSGSYSAGGGGAVGYGGSPMPAGRVYGSSGYGPSGGGGPRRVQYAGGTGNRPGGMSSRFGGGDTSQPSTGSGLYQHASSAPQPQSGGTFSSRFNTGSEPTADQVLTHPTATARQEQTQMQESQQQPVQNENGPFAFEAGIGSWVPTQAVPYLPAYDPTKYQLVFQKKDGELRPNLMQLPTDMLDYNRHDIKTIFGEAPKVLNLADPKVVNEALAAGLKEMNEVKPGEGEDAAPQLSVLIDQRTPLETSEEAAWTNSSISRVSLIASGKRADIFRSYACILKPIITEKDENDFLVNLEAARTYLEVRDIMVEQAKEISLDLFSTVERKMTAVINNVLKNQLSLVDVTIDSFVGDIEELLNMVRDSYGEMMYDALIKHQRRYIALTFQRWNDETHAALKELLFGDREYTEESPAPHVAYLAQMVSMTHLDCSVHELDIDFSDKTSATVLQKFFPVMYSIIDSILSYARKEPRIARNLIRTNDGYILEVFEGDLGGGHYLISRTN